MKNFWQKVLVLTLSAALPVAVSAQQFTNQATGVGQAAAGATAVDTDINANATNAGINGGVGVSGAEVHQNFEAGEPVPFLPGGVAPAPLVNPQIYSNLTDPTLASIKLATYLQNFEPTVINAAHPPEVDEPRGKNTGMAWTPHSNLGTYPKQKKGIPIDVVPLYAAPDFPVRSIGILAVYSTNKKPVFLPTLHTEGALYVSSRLGQYSGLGGRVYMVSLPEAIGVAFGVKSSSGGIIFQALTSALLSYFGAPAALGGVLGGNFSSGSSDPTARIGNVYFVCMEDPSGRKLDLASLYSGQPTAAPAKSVPVPGESKTAQPVSLVAKPDQPTSTPVPEARLPEPTVAAVPAETMSLDRFARDAGLGKLGTKRTGEFLAGSLASDGFSIPKAVGQRTQSVQLIRTGRVDGPCQEVRIKVDYTPRLERLTRDMTGMVCPAG